MRTVNIIIAMTLLGLVLSIMLKASFEDLKFYMVASATMGLMVGLLIAFPHGNAKED